MRRPMGSGPYAKRFFKLRFTTTLVTDPAGVFTGEFVDNPNQSLDFTNIAALFDTYKFCAMRIKYIPSFPNDTSSQHLYTPLYVVGDPNDTTPLTTTNQAIEYENMQVKDLQKPWKYYYKFPTATIVSGAGTQVVLAGGYRNVNSIVPARAIKMISTNLTASSTYGTFIVSMYLTVKNRI